MTRLHVTLASAQPTAPADLILASRVLRALIAYEPLRGAVVRVDVADIAEVAADRYSMREGARAVAAPRDALAAIVARVADELAGEQLAEGWT